MSTLILNRDWEHPKDNWYHLEALGNHPNAAGKVVQVVDAAAVQQMCNRFAVEAAKPDFAGMLVDHEHFKANPDQETRAYGWLMAVQARADGLYGQIRWTNTGREAVDGGDYRYFSTEYDPNDCEKVGDGKIRPLRLAGLTLTNDPNNKGQRPITNRNADCGLRIAELGSGKLILQKNEPGRVGLRRTQPCG
ncbi:MAG: phage protease, partial [Verrucomicrobiota bacterium]